ncbi:hypothetical protein CONPUDRAFT_76523 [Coniophora puteana RWD-64-598 SS2]|uniref:Ubiquitin 3 binding protein But2 C-terminal domain-containing protein n=1 Tax=Coniophora puteana (strain RWD-64-598) TaxID=741705 RepID=A0A5M3MAH1_CONPW|nr:uncharacterized protein CONPUDRAFT_76523 [Coniophora puteana RWD-64-598 SS2]EIW76107.1 hypothetical protein CONPUDRAFT_76523 [Coniophora puteana RWD-64-598 SS2]
MFRAISLSLVAAASYFSIVAGIPTWENSISRSVFESPFVPGASILEVLGPMRRTRQADDPKYLGVGAPHGYTGRAVVQKEPLPPLFFINQNQLWQYNNESYIYPVNVVNSTLTADAPLQLTIDDKQKGINGRWRWAGSSLQYDYSDKTNRGVYYTCQDKSGLKGVYMFLDMPKVQPHGCEVVTIHGFMRQY